MEKQILKIADDLRNGEITPEYAQDLLLRLFGVIKSVCVSCDKETETHEVCMKCISEMIADNQQTVL